MRDADLRTEISGEILLRSAHIDFCRGRASTDNASPVAACRGGVAGHFSLFFPFPPLHIVSSYVFLLNVFLLHKDGRNFVREVLQGMLGGVAGHVGRCCRHVALGVGIVSDVAHLIGQRISDALLEAFLQFHVIYIYI